MDGPAGAPAAAALAPRRPDAELTRAVPFFSQAASFEEIWPSVARHVNDVADRGKYSHGRKVGEFEKALAGYTGARFAIAMNSGTDALVLLLRAAGLQPGDEVVVPAFSFVATATSVSLARGRPAFADIDPISYALDPASAAAAVTARTRAVMPVHLFHQMADMAALGELAGRHDLVMVEDSAEAIGMRWDGRHAGLLGTGGVLSFFPTKTLGALGDAGLVLTDDPEVAERAGVLRHHGRLGRTIDHIAGISNLSGVSGTNSKMDDLQAAVLLAKLDRLDRDIARRAELAAAYGERLRDVPGVLRRADRGAAGGRDQPGLVRLRGRGGAPRRAGRAPDRPRHRHGDLLPVAAAPAAVLRRPRLPGRPVPGRGGGLHANRRAAALPGSRRLRRRRGLRRDPLLLRREVGVTLPFFPPDLFEADREALLKILHEVAVSPDQKFILGTRTAELERALREDTGAGDVIACSSGTGGLNLSVAALGIGPGDEVIVPAFCCQPVASSVANAGGTPVFADVDPWTMVMDPADTERRITRRGPGDHAGPRVLDHGRHARLHGPGPPARAAGHRGRGGRPGRRCSAPPRPAAGATSASSPSSRSRRSAPPARAAWC